MFHKNDMEFIDESHGLPVPKSGIGMSYTLLNPRYTWWFDDELPNIYKGMLIVAHEILPFSIIIYIYVRKVYPLCLVINIPVVVVVVVAVVVVVVVVVVVGGGGGVVGVGVGVGTNKHWGPENKLPELILEFA